LFSVEFPGENISPSRTKNSRKTELEVGEKGKKILNT
jgi:hypothetical protein